MDMKKKGRKLGSVDRSLTKKLRKRHRIRWCGGCGSGNSETARFCHKCGKFMGAS